MYLMCFFFFLLGVAGSPSEKLLTSSLHYRFVSLIIHEFIT